uniref:Mitogen-activated protein kinase kinase kinase 4 n=1 Tax=Geotrypetes seraphini TaxID=260995 RepID=A0A6P8QB71_GEOSA|nr:mitogen-activated protein kinase kinase kinase 4 isoform X1 [Geotrypetes seraphini]XP_033793619.1 mitogen-activated protein kinase kinase kinase 4 isoform X1 [Geotrypetes seraphini]XP_033793620.1 mitogen-activated protein kinase kinase kinase 4 isoform X1 [Geotrypetes seraphini]XP_033793621.1 mitogen-activated protein kinase kinase kinase 4 isoform X1 [Geotrypetes seraphini]XP_033793622.1 mitogen-activated protein kinase kinase kinase 4 isoform X1 [Geotrypetes seraphini]XP_033793623.1 mitog
MKHAATKSLSSEPEDFSDEAISEIFYGTSPPSTPRQMKRMSSKHQRSNTGKPAVRSALKEKMSTPNQASHRDGSKTTENVEDHSYKQEKKIRATLRTTERDHKKNVQCSFMLDSVTGSLPKKSIPDVDLNKPYLSLGCSNAKLPVSVPVPIARTARQTSRTDCPADRLKFFETLRLLLKLTSISKKKEREQRGHENTAMWLNRSNELIWLELQAWHAGRSINDQDFYLYTARQAIPEIINEILTFKVNFDNFSYVNNGAGLNGTSVEGPCKAIHSTNAVGHSIYHDHLQRQRVSFEQVKRIMELLEYVEALYPSLQALQKDYEKYAAKDFQDRVQALCLWLNITKDLNHKLRIMGTVLGIKNLSDIGWPVFEIPSPRPSKDDDFEDEEDEMEGEEIKESSGTCTEESDGEELISDRSLAEIKEAIKKNFGNKTKVPFPQQDHFLRRLDWFASDDDSLCSGIPECNLDTDCSRYCLTSIYRPFVDKALKQMGLRKLILRLHKLMHGSLQRARVALIKTDHPVEFSEFPDPMLCSDYLPDLLKQFSNSMLCSERKCSPVSWEELKAMDLPSFEPAFLVLCRVLLNVIHECLKLRLEQRPAGEPSLLSIKQLVRECKEVLKGGLLMKQYYQFMTREVLDDSYKINCNIDSFEEDLHKMLMVYFDYMRSWIQMLQQLPQASHSLKNLLEEEWNFTKEITPYIRGGEAQAGRLFCDIAGMLLKSTGNFLDSGLQDSCDEFWASADDSSASDEIRRSVIETSRALKELFHEARERASKALGFAKMLRKDLEIAAEFTYSAPVQELLSALQAKQYMKVQIPGLDNLHVFVPDNLSGGKSVILQLLNAAAGKDCSKDAEEVTYEAYLLMTKHRDKDQELEDTWDSWDGQSIKVVPQVETTDTLRSMQVNNLLLVVTQSTHLVNQRKAFQQSIEGLLTLHHEQTSSQPLIATALQQLKNEALQLCTKISDAIDRVDHMFTSEFEAEVDESESATLQQYYREAMIQGYNFGFEYHKEAVRLMSGEYKQKIGDKYISFARKWMNYVLTKCESGRGTRPRWATQGFDYLQAIEPAFISALPEDDFLSLQALMNECIGHVIGKPHSPVTGLYLAIHRSSPRPVKVPRCHSDPPNPHLIIPNPEGFSVSSHHSNRIVSSDVRNLSNAAVTRPTPISSDSTPPKPVSSTNDTRGSSVPENDRLASIAAELQFRSLSRHSSPTEEKEEPSYPKGDLNSSSRRSWELRSLLNQTRDTASKHGPMYAIQKSVRLFEQERYRNMRRKNIIGQVCDTPKSYDNVMHVGLRKVTFKWQRGNKIGEGQYGKVYTCINVDTGELMAMKEIRFQPNDHKTIKETADELKIFEGIKHPNLVRYFGVELHREEMYIFMEYCDEGTLEEVARLGLQEHVIRLYSKQITIAINVLHEHGIVHRDIKGANIFLTSSGLIKLGDFGCSVKLKNNAQTMPGEVNSTLGTAAYMAPEVITRAKGEGHGRAADIWSLGCVVIEMVTGKRPWHEYEHNFQIMYKVGMGHKPPIPERLSPEGKDFLCHCLESDPKMRWTASQLLDHPFVKVCTDEE